MNTTTLLRRWLLAGLLTIFISACATTQEDLGETDGPPDDGSSQGQLDGSQGGDSGSVDASGIDDGSGGAATSIVDDSQLSAREALEQSAGVLANRTIYF